MPFEPYYGGAVCCWCETSTPKGIDISSEFRDTACYRVYCTNCKYSTCIHGSKDEAKEAWEAGEGFISINTGGGTGFVKCSCGSSKAVAYTKRTVRQDSRGQEVWMACFGCGRKTDPAPFGKVIMAWNNDWMRVENNSNLLWDLLGED